MYTKNFVIICVPGDCYEWDYYKVPEGSLLEHRLIQKGGYVVSPDDDEYSQALDECILYD